MSNNDVRETVADYWSPSDLRDRVAAVLDASDLEVTLEALAEFDQLHAQGSEVTLELGRRAQISASDRVLDVGSGVGGPARLIAATFGCHVTGVDLTPAYVETATYLSARTGMSDQVDFHVGDATDLPFDDAAFDVVWTQHAAQSIPSKPALFSELSRVLKPGGVLVIHDLARMYPGAPVTFPAAWAPDPSIDFLAPVEEMRSLMDANGLEIEVWRDTTAETRAWSQALIDSIAEKPEEAEQPKHGASGLDITLIFGDEDPVVHMVNCINDLDSGAVGFFEAIARKRT